MRFWIGLLACALWMSSAYGDEPTVRFGTEAADAPFEFKGADGTLQGAEIELGNALCDRMKVKCVWVNMDFDGLIPALNAQKIDAALSQMSVTTERRQSVDFTDRLTDVPAQFVAAKDSGITDAPATLKGKTIGVQSGTTHERYLNEKLKGIVEVKVYQNQDDAFLDLQAGRIDATLCDKALSFDWLHKQGGGDYEFVGKPLDDPAIFGDGTAIAVRKGDDTLRLALNKAIADLAADGTLDRIFGKYFPFSVRPS